MKKKNIFLCAIIIFIVTIIANLSYAANEKVELKSSAETIKKGETFTVTLAVECEDGINGIDTKYVYDKDKLELVSSEVIDTANWSSLGAENDITVICNSITSIKKADVYSLKFKVKEKVLADEILKIETTQILLDTDKQENSEVTLPAIKTEIKVIEENNSEKNEGDNTNQPTNNENNTEDKTNQPANNEKPEEDKTSQPTNNENIKKEENTNKANSEDKTIIKTKLPNTGKNILVIYALIIGGIVLAIVFYNKYIKYKLF